MFQEDTFLNPHHEGWVVRVFAMFDELMNNKCIFVDRGEIRFFPDVYNRAGVRSLKVDVAARERMSFNHTPLRRQFSVAEAARSDDADKLAQDSTKIILAAANMLVALQRTASQSSATMRRVAIPVFIYSGMLWRRRPGARARADAQ